MSASSYHYRHSQLKVMIIESLMNKICDLLRKKKPDENPVHQSSLVVLQVLCVKLKCLVQRILRNVYLQLYRPQH